MSCPSYFAALAERQPLHLTLTPDLHSLNIAHAEDSLASFADPHTVRASSSATDLANSVYLISEYNRFTDLTFPQFLPHSILLLFFSKHIGQRDLSPTTCRQSPQQTFPHSLQTPRPEFGVTECPQSSATNSISTSSESRIVYSQSFPDLGGCLSDCVFSPVADLSYLLLAQPSVRSLRCQPDGGCCYASWVP